jgi:hypothetical protein
MEEMSFRSGAAVGAGTLAAAGTAIALAVTLTGHSAAATSAPGPTAPSAPSAPALSAPSAVTPSVTPSPTPVTRSSPTASPQGYQPVSWAAAVTTPQATPQPAVRLGPPRRPRLRIHPASMNMGEPIPLAHPFGG